MTFNTGNPIGSTDARDLSDNAENFDKALNSTAETWNDRLGNTRDTFEGALSKLSFYRVGTFAAGYTLTNMRQTLEYNGHEYGWAGTFPKVVAAGATPATSGGIGAGAWVDRTDETLRGDLNIVVKTFQSVSNMVADPSLVVGQKCKTLGYYSAGDGGANEYEIVNANTSPSDGGSYIDLNGSGYQAKGLFINGSSTIFQFGAKGDGITDDSSPIQAYCNANPDHAIIYIPSKKHPRIANVVTFHGRRLEIIGDSGVMTNKVMENTHSQLFCDVNNDFAIKCTQADLQIRNVIVRGIENYAGGTIGNRKGISTDAGAIQTFFASFIGFDTPIQIKGGFYNKFYNTEWLACRQCIISDVLYNISFFGCRAAAFDKFLPLTGSAGQGPISFFGCAFEQWTNYIVGSETPLYVRWQNIGFYGCYFENFDDLTVYTGLTTRGGAATLGDPYYGKYAYARIVFGTPWSVVFDTSTTIYTKGLENVIASNDSWGIGHLSVKAKLAESDWATHQKPLSVILVQRVSIIDSDCNSTAINGLIAYPFITSDNVSALPSITSGRVVVTGRRIADIKAKYTQNVVFSGVNPGTNAYVDVTFTNNVQLVEACASLISRSSTTSACTIQLETISSSQLRVHVTNTGSVSSNYTLKLIVPYGLSN